MRNMPQMASIHIIKKLFLIFNATNDTIKLQLDSSKSIIGLERLHHQT